MIKTQADRRQTSPVRRPSFSIRTSALVFILATAIVFCVLLGLTTYTYRFAMEQRGKVSDWHVTQLHSAENLRYLYLKYEHTWGDILLRGHNPHSYHTQLSNFYELERRIQTSIEELARELGANKPAIAALRTFEQEFYQAGRLYRRALRTYNEDISEPQFAADAIIHNASIDPVRRNTELIESLESSRYDRYDQITRKTQYFERSITLIVLFLICAFLLLVYYLSKRFIISPINEAISLAEHISRGELDNVLERKYAATEINNLLQSLKRMQLNISHAQQELITAKEQAEQSNEAKSIFLSRMSHELRTPLHAILGFSQILKLQPDELTPRQRNNIDKIIKAGQHLLNLINEVLDLARIDNDRMDVLIENLELSDIVNECIVLTNPMAEEKSVKLINQIPSDQQYVVRADDLRLTQALINLITNAIKYGNDEGTVILDSHKISENTVRIEVSDNGPGIPAEKQHLLFKPFERLDNTQLVEGTGIGLALTRKLVDLMHGNTGVETEPGKGSTFWIQLPLSDRSPSLEHAITRITDGSKTLLSAD